MKKIITHLTFIALLSIGFQANAQDWCLNCNPTTTGFVRIGMNTPFTTKQLYVRSSNTDHVALFENVNQNGNGMIISSAHDPLRVGGLNNHSGNWFIVKRDPTSPSYGIVGINKSNPNDLFSLDVVGSVQSFGYFTTSDERAKKEIQPDAINHLGLYGLKTYSYRYKEEKMDRSHFGVMAQEVSKVFPDLVAGDDEDGYSVNYTEMIPLLIRAVQDQKQTIDNLTEKLNNLESRISNNPELAELLDFEGERMTLFPNPANHVTNVSLKGTRQGNVSLEVINLNGEVVKSIDSNGPNASINTSDMLKGVYFVRYLRDGKLIETKRLLIEK